MRIITGLFPKELKQWCAEQNEAPFRAKQVLDWIYQKGAVDFNEMSNLSKALREKLASSFTLPVLKLRRTTDSGDGETIKFLWELPEGRFVESVLISSGERRTVCVSSQVGCPARCAFCASGQQGFFRNLEAGEIVEQLILIQNWLRQRDEKITNVVFMGMGEPLRNTDNVLRTIRLITSPDLMGLGQRRITVSTVGVVEGIERMSEEELKVNLVLSLHAPNDHVRKKIIPYARTYAIKDILAAMDKYARATKRDITYEYILIDGINVEPEHAEELATLVKGRQCSVNLIPYNHVEGVKLQRPSNNAIRRFRDILQKRGVVNTCRYTKGDDIAAACGQLAMLESA